MKEIMVWMIVILIVVFGSAQLQANDDKIYFDYTPSKFLDEPENVEKSQSKPNTGQTNDKTNEISAENIKLLNGPRHDAFDWSLIKKVLSDYKQNTVISPFLIKLLLAILAEMAGSGSGSHRELLSNLPGIESENDLRELYAKPFVSLLQKSTDYELDLGAKLFIDAKIGAPRQKFVSIIKSFYDSDVVPLDFANVQEALKVINAWCAAVTHNHINDIISADDAAHSVILLVNTIYFNGSWNESFDEDRTISQNFWLDSKTNFAAQFMRKISNFYYGESSELDAKFLRLPYKGGKFAMYIVLPNKIDGLNDLISNIDSSEIHEMQFLKTQIKVSLPKFKILNTIKLNEYLKSLGIRKMFTTPASLPQLVRGTSKGDLQVSNVLQKIGIEVNEKGSTASASPIASLDKRIDSAIEFKVDRPFLFFIFDETTGTLIFSGKVVHPA